MFLTDIFGCVFSGLEADGIYRVSGNLATIQKLRFIVDQGRFNRNSSRSLLFLFVAARDVLQPCLLMFSKDGRLLKKSALRLS